MKLFWKLKWECDRDSFQEEVLRSDRCVFPHSFDHGTMLPTSLVQDVSITPWTLGHMCPGAVTKLLCVVGLVFPLTFNRSLEFLCTFLLCQGIWYMLINTKIFVASVIFVLVCMCSCVHKHVHMCGGQRSALGIYFNCSPSESFEIRSFFEPEVYLFV
jgi:hypothetical protein